MVKKIYNSKKNNKLTAVKQQTVNITKGHYYFLCDICFSDTGEFITEKVIADSNLYSKNWNITQAELLGEEEAEIRKKLRNLFWMKWNKCNNPKADNWKYYGAKGVSMMDEFAEVESFIDFCLNMDSFRKDIYLKKIRVYEDFCISPGTTEVEQEIRTLSLELDKDLIAFLLKIKPNYIPDQCIWLEQREHQAVSYNIGKYKAGRQTRKETEIILFDILRRVDFEIYQKTRKSFKQPKEIQAI